MVRSFAGTLLRRMARQDGILLKADRPLGPMDLMLGNFINATRTLPATAGGARAWHTHVTCAPESPEAPELATRPTRALVSHVGYDATLRLTAPEALKQLPGHHLQWIVVGLNTTTVPFAIRGADLYPAATPEQHVASRSFYQPACANNTDPFAPESGCLHLQKDSSGDVLDISASPAPCPAVGLCRHQLTVHSIFALPAAGDRAVLLGDLSAYVSLSGYRFRHLPGDPSQIVVVGAPKETVPVTYLVPSAASASGWIAKVAGIVVGADGRTQFAMV